MQNKASLNKINVLAGYAHEQGKAVVIVVNKWDTVEKDSKTMKKFEDEVRKEFQFLDYAQIAFCVC